MSAAHLFDHMLSLAAHVASESKDPNTQVGCLIMAHERIVTSGHNAVPEALDNTPERWERPQKYQWIEHAERRAINNAARHGATIGGGTAFVTLFPCSGCARSLIDAGIARVVAPEPSFYDGRWGTDWNTAYDMLLEANIEVVFREVPDVPQ